MYLFINTARKSYIEVGLLKEKNGRLKFHRRQISRRRSERILNLIAHILPAEKQKKIKGIVVVVGPGPFTAVRMGITVANTLSLLWQVPLFACPFLLCQKSLACLEQRRLVKVALPEEKDFLCTKN